MVTTMALLSCSSINAVKSSSLHICEFSALQASNTPNKHGNAWFSVFLLLSSFSKLVFPLQAAVHEWCKSWMELHKQNTFFACNFISILYCIPISSTTWSLSEAFKMFSAFFALWLVVFSLSPACIRSDIVQSIEVHKDTFHISFPRRKVEDADLFPSAIANHLVHFQSCCSCMKEQALSCFPKWGRANLRQLFAAGSLHLKMFRVKNPLPTALQAADWILTQIWFPSEWRNSYESTGNLKKRMRYSTSCLCPRSATNDTFHDLCNFDYTHFPKSKTP